MSEVIEFPGITKGDVPVAKVLEGVAHLKCVVVVGVDAKGDFYAASSSGDITKVLWLKESQL